MVSVLYITGKCITKRIHKRIRKKNRNETQQRKSVHGSLVTAISIAAQFNSSVVDQGKMTNTTRVVEKIESFEKDDFEKRGFGNDGSRDNLNTDLTSVCVSLVCDSTSSERKPVDSRSPENSLENMIP